jgi:hypothetical protein
LEKISGEAKPESKPKSATKVKGTGTTPVQEKK